MPKNVLHFRLLTDFDENLFESKQHKDTILSFYI